MEKVKGNKYIIFLNHMYEIDGFLRNIQSVAISLNVDVTIYKKERTIKIGDDSIYIALFMIDKCLTGRLDHGVINKDQVYSLLYLRKIKMLEDEITKLKNKEYGSSNESMKYLALLKYSNDTKVIFSDDYENLYNEIQQISCDHKLIVEAKRVLYEEVNSSNFNV